MKRLALALAAAVTALGTGCGSDHHRCANSVTVDWRGGFQTATGAVGGCAAANVAWIDLFINDDASTAVRVPCTQGTAAAVDLPNGTNLFTVEGIDVRSGSDRIAFRAEVNVGFACGDQAVAVTPAEGTLAVNYAFTPANVCFATQPTYMWSQVFDRIANQVAFRDTAQSVANQCGATLTYRLPAGLYTFDGINEWGPGPVGYVGADCTPREFEIVGAATTPVSPALGDFTTACF